VPKQEKIETVEEIKEKLDSAKIAILTEFQGLNVAEMTELRRLFRDADIDYKVYKNTLTRIAAHELGVTDIDNYLLGTTALAFGNDPVSPAKIVKDFRAKHRNFVVKAGILDKRLIASDDVIALADIPPKEVLFAMIMGAMQSPISGLLSVIQAPARNFIYILKSLAEQKVKDAESDQPAEETGESDGEKGGESMAITKEEIIETIGSMTVLELSQLVKDMESKFGVSAAMPMAGFMPAQGAEAAQEAEEEEQTEFSVILMSSGEKKIQVIKEVRAVTSLALKDAKALVDEAPSPIKEGIGKEEAEELKAKLEAAGATVELK
jgi:large subunit ribosomal protein L7/L12